MDLVSVPNSEKIREQYDNALNSILSISRDIDLRLKILEEKERCWNAIEKKMEENSAKAKTKIKLDIGGKKFTTSKSSLLRFHNSYFYAMISSGKWEPDEDGNYIVPIWSDLSGEYFIDRNPKYFDHILDYLRTGEFSTEGLDETALKKLKADFDYFQIESPDTTFPRVRQNIVK